MPGGLERGLQKGLDVGIGLAMKKFELDQAQDMFNVRMQMAQDEIDQKKAELLAETEAEKIKRIIEDATESIEQGQKAGSQEIIGKASKIKEKHGLLGAPKVPSAIPLVTEIAKDLREEVGMPEMEGIPMKYWTEPSPAGKEPKLYETTKGWQKTPEAIGLKKPTKPSTDKAPTLKPMMNTQGKWTYHQWSNGKWVDTGMGAKAPSDKEPESKKTLKSLKASYEKTVGRYNLAAMGVGQFVPDPNKEIIAQQEKQRAVNLAIQYKKAGGKPEDLGITAEGIREDYKAGKMEKKQAVRLLKELFGMK